MSDDPITGKAPENCGATDRLPPTAGSIHESLETIRLLKALHAEQSEVLKVAIKRLDERRRLIDSLSKENHRLKKELEGYKNGRLWTIVSGLIPTMTWRDGM